MAKDKLHESALSALGRTMSRGGSLIGGAHLVRVMSAAQGWASI